MIILQCLLFFKAEVYYLTHANKNTTALEKCNQWQKEIDLKTSKFVNFIWVFDGRPESEKQRPGLTRQRLVPSPGALNDREVGGGQNKISKLKLSEPASFCGRIEPATELWTKHIPVSTSGHSKNILVWGPINELAPYSPFYLRTTRRCIATFFQLFFLCAACWRCKRMPPLMRRHSEKVIGRIVS